MSPGSSAAKNLGCICDAVSNNYGVGVVGDIYGRRYIVVESCIVHGLSSWMSPKVNDNYLREATHEDGTYELFIPLRKE